jgi:hypothetical protein
MSLFDDIYQRAAGNLHIICVRQKPGRTKKGKGHKTNSLVQPAARTTLPRVLGKD